MTSKDIDDKWGILYTTLEPAVSGVDLRQLFSNQTTFTSAYNDWNLLKKELTQKNEEEYVNYMGFLEHKNQSLVDAALDISAVSYDNSCKSVSSFVKKQLKALSNKKDLIFPFVKDEIIGWDSKSFIIRDTIYYSISGKRAIYFLNRLDITE